LVDVIYIERELLDHTRVKKICDRFPAADRVVCERYGEVFNPKRQNFRLQKRRSALILARKHEAQVLPAPAGYGLGSEHNYYFSHILNCVYDCRYCFLQGMYHSANYVLFVNYEDFADAITETCAKQAVEKGSPIWFFSGYDGDSLAYEPVTGFVDFILPVFARLPGAFLELRTKSTQARCLAKRKPMSNVVVAYSFTPDNTSRSLEHKVPSVEKRLAAAAQLQAQGWQIGLRFDPLIYTEDYRREYRELMNKVFTYLDPALCHSVTFGPFRLPQGYFKKMVRLYPDEPLFAGPLQRKEKVVSYQPGLESELVGYCKDLLREYIVSAKLFSQNANLQPHSLIS